MNLGFQCTTQAKAGPEGNVNVSLSSTWVMRSVLHPSQNISSPAPESPQISVCLLKPEKGLTAHRLSLTPALPFLNQVEQVS